MTFLETIGADNDSGDLPPFLDADAKNELATSQHPFFIVGGIPSRDGQYGAQTFYEIRFGTPGKTTKTQTGESITITAPGWAANAEVWTLTLTANDERSGQMQKIKEALAVGETGFVGPCFLHRIATKSGHPYWKVRGTRDESPMATPTPVNGGSSSTQTQPATDTIGDESDGIPFAHDDTFMVT